MKTVYEPHDPGMIVTEIPWSEYLEAAGLVPLDYLDRPGEPVTIASEVGK